MQLTRLQRGAAMAALLLALTATGPVVAQAAETGWEQQSHKGAQFVQVTLGQSDLFQGLRLVAGLPDGQTRAIADESGRQTVAGAAGAERFFYFDVHDTYIKGGQNRVRMTITYRDLGLTPLFLEYDSFDPLRPRSRVDELIRKRVHVATRTNTEGWKTAFVELEDARFDGTQPGGADFRVGSSDDLSLSNVSVMLIAHKEPAPLILVELDGKPVVFDPNEVQPFIQNERTLVPFRALFGALGVPGEQITWESATRTVVVQKGKTIIRLPIDKQEATVNGVPYLLDQPAIIVGGRTVVPIRFVAEQFGLDVSWREGNGVRTVVLTTRPVVSDPSVTPPQPPTPKP